MESLKIVLASVLAAILYGIIHDQITARVCVEYFSVFHPPVFGTQSPALLALGWGVIATWWVGAFLGIVLAITARAGSRPKLGAAALLSPIAKLLAVMAMCALTSAVIGYVLARNGMIFPPEWVALSIPPPRYARFMADWWAHGASYGVGIIGGIVVCVAQYRKRRRDVLDPQEKSIDPRA